MADAPESTPKIDSLRAKVEADAKSRHFYPLAEELRKVDQLEEAEKVLRAGLAHHPSYLSAWISLGRVLKERGAHAEAVDVLMKGLSLDPENVVAAKLLAHVHLAMGDKVEAIKKFKLVYALMPADEEAEAQINALNRELNPERYAFAAPPAPSAMSVPAEQPAASPAAPAAAHADSRMDATEPPFPTESEPLESPESQAHQADPFGESVAEAPPEMNLDLTNPDPLSLGAGEPTEDELPDQEAPFGSTDLPAMEGDSGADGNPFDSGEPEAEPSPARAPSSEDVWSDESDQSGSPALESVATVTMAQILAEQGHLDRAREIYERVLERDPQNEEAREGLIALSPKGPRRIEVESRVSRLEQWRLKVVGS